jgi:hypothetical protein
MQRIQHSAQTGEQPAALFALADVALYPLTPIRAELSVEIGRHVVWRPPMIPPEARAVQVVVAHHVI